MMKEGYTMKAFKLWILAMFLISVVNIVNRIKFKQQIKHLSKKDRRIKLAEYDRQEAIALDKFAGRNYRTLWNDYLIIKGGYEIGELDETISSALGKNQYDNTLSKKGKGKLSKRFYGEGLVKILDKLDPEHCVKSIDITKGKWQYK